MRREKISLRLRILLSAVDFLEFAFGLLIQTGALGKLLLEFSNGLVKLCELCGLLTRVSVAWTVSRLGEGEEERRLTSSWDRRGRRCRGRE